MQNGQRVIAVSNIWHNLVKEGATGQIVKVLETGYNVFFPLSDHYKYEDQIFYCESDKIKAID